MPVQDIPVQFHKSNCNIQIWPLPQFLILCLCFSPPSWQVLTSRGFLTLWTVQPEADYLWQQPGGRSASHDDHCVSDWCCISACFVPHCLFKKRGAEIPHRQLKSVRCNCKSLQPSEWTATLSFNVLDTLEDDKLCMKISTLALLCVHLLQALAL